MFREGSRFAFERRQRVAVFVVLVPEVGLQLPTSCAACLQPAAHAVAEKHRERTVLVPYCAACRDALARTVSFRLAAVVAAVLLAVTWALVLPRLWPGLTPGAYTAVVAAVAALPGFLTLVIGPAARQGSSAPGRAAWWWGPNHLACVTRRWAGELASLNASEVQAAGRRWSPTPWLAVFGVPLLSAAVAPLAYAYLFPALIVLNLSAGPAALFVDGRELGLVDSTSLESPSAGLRVRVATGQHLLELRTLADDHPVAPRRVHVEPGGQYLYAPASEGVCFWLEYDAYGRRARERRRVPLSPDSEFWRLPARIDTWFADNPPAGADARSSGGTMLALRHAPCERTGRNRAGRSP